MGIETETQLTHAKQPVSGDQNVLTRLTAWALQLTIVRAFLRYSEHRGPMLADSITYRALFSVFAGVLLGFSVAALWLGGNPEALQQLATGIDSYLPGISNLIDVTAIEAPVGFSIVGLISVIGLIAAALSAIGSIRNALHDLADMLSPPPMVVWLLLRNAAVGVLFVALLLVGVAAAMLTSVGNAWLADWLGISSDSPVLVFGARAGGLLISLTVNTLAIIVAFRLLSGVSAHGSAIWVGSVTGGFGLLVLQEFSALFVRGATNNPLLASFAVLISLLLWMNLSSQVILISSSLIITMAAEKHNRVHEKFGASTLVQRRRLRAEQRMEAAVIELHAARDAERVEREALAAKAQGAMHRG